LKSQESADDLQREYIKEASERICKCLKEDFAPFLPSLMPGMFKAMKVEGIAAEVNDGGDETQYITLDVGGGKTMKVHTSKFEECTQAVQMLHTFAEEMGPAFFPYIQDSAQALLPLLTDDDAMSACNEEARGAAMQAWGLLIKSAKQAHLLQLELLIGAVRSMRRSSGRRELKTLWKFSGGQIPTAVQISLWRNCKQLRTAE